MQNLLPLPMVMMTTIQRHIELQLPSNVQRTDLLKTNRKTELNCMRNSAFNQLTFNSVPEQLKEDIDRSCMNGIVLNIILIVPDNRITPVVPFMQERSVSHQDKGSLVGTRDSSIQSSNASLLRQCLSCHGPRDTEYETWRRS